MCSFILAGSKIQNLFGYVTCFIVQSVIPLIFTLAVVMFVWGVVQYFIIGAGEEAKREQGKQFAVWGLIALVAISSVWGLVRILGDTFNINTRLLPTGKPSNLTVPPPGSDPDDGEYVDSPMPEPCVFAPGGCDRPPDSPA